MSLTNKTMLSYLKIKLLGMEQNDHKISNQVNAHLQTQFNAGVYRKCRINRKDIKMVISAAEKARATHRDLTRPWAEDGWRMLPSTLVMKYTAEMRAGKAVFEKAIRDIENTWAIIVNKQELRLGPLFKFTDYPYVYSRDNPAPGQKPYIVDKNPNLSKHYLYEYKMRPTPEAGHFILDLEQETIDELKLKLNDENAKNLASSKIELWKRLFEPVKNMADICSNDKKIFKTLISNVKKQLDLLKDLNVTDDADLNKMIADVKYHLTGFTPGQIRGDKRLKKQLGQTAHTLSTTMEGYMGGSTPK